MTELHDLSTDDKIKALMTITGGGADFSQDYDALYLYNIIIIAFY